MDRIQADLKLPDGPEVLENDGSESPDVFTKVDDIQLVWDRDQILGTGSFATVYHCEYGGKICALKHIRGFSSLTDRERRMMKKEAAIMQQTNHPNIISFVAFDLNLGTIVCERANCSLHDVIHQESVRDKMQLKCVDFAMKLQWMVEISEALDYLHSSKIIHRDIKPCNVLLVIDSTSQKFIAKISDFGISSAVGMSTISSSSVGHGGPVGSAAYMAPELIKNASEGMSYTAKVDIYSFGVLINEIMSQEVPWASLHPLQIMSNIFCDNRPRLFAPKTDAEKSLFGIIGDKSAGCWSNDPSVRYSACDLVRQLKNILNLTSGVVQPVSSVKRMTTKIVSLQSLKERSDAISLCQVGMIYLIGKGIHRTDDKEDIYQCRRMWNWDHRLKIRFSDKDIEVNHKLALKYFTKSLDSAGVLDFHSGIVGMAHCFLSVCNFSRAYKLFSSAAELEHPLGYCGQANMLQKGYLGPRNHTKCFELYELAAEKNCDEGLYRMGHNYFYGNGVDCDKGKAFSYYLRSAERGHEEGHYLVGLGYYNGEGLEKNLEEAFKHFKAYADLGFEKGCAMVGRCYYSGTGVAVNFTEAVKYLRYTRDKDCLFYLAMCYYEGKGTVRDVNQALIEFGRSKTRGHHEALDWINKCKVELGLK